MNVWLRLAFWFFFWMALLPRLLMPAHAYTKQQATACYPDAVRLCGAPPNYRSYFRLPANERARIVGCMMAHAFSLSRECLSGFGR